jgi:hypothetical protein
MSTNERCSAADALGADAEANEIGSAMAVAAALAKDWKLAAGGPIPEVMAGWMGPHYLFETRKEFAALPPDGPDRLKLLRQMAGDIVALQCGGHWVPRLELETRKLELEREKFEFEKEKHRQALVAGQSPPPKERDCFRPLTDAERLAIIDKADEILGLK